MCISTHESYFPLVFAGTLYHLLTLHQNDDLRGRRACDVAGLVGDVDWAELCSLSTRFLMV